MKILYVTINLIEKYSQIHQTLRRTLRILHISGNLRHGLQGQVPADGHHGGAQGDPS